MDFKYLFRLLLNRKWIIIGSAILAGVVAWYFTRHEEKTYRSFTQISTGYTITDQIPRIGVDQNTDFMGTETKFSNALVTMTSPTVVNLLSYALIIHDLESPHPFRQLSPELKKSPLYSSVDKAKALIQFRENLQNMTVLNSNNPEEKQLLEFLSLYRYDYKSISKVLNDFRLQHTDYIQIEYASNNPDLSAFVVNNTFQQFLRYYNTTRSDKSRESIDTLRSLMERKKQEFEAKNSLLRGEQPTTALDSHKYDQISNLDKTLTDQKTNQTKLYYDLRKVNQRLADMGVGTQEKAVPTDNSTVNSELLALRNSMSQTYSAYVNGGSSDATLLNKYNNLKQQYQAKLLSIAPAPVSGDDKTSDNPEVRKQQLIEKRNDINLDIQAAEATIADLENRLSQLRGNAIQEASRGAAVETLIKEADQANKDYQAAKQRYNEALDITSSAPSNFRQVLIGQPAIEPEPSKKIIIVGAATIGVFVIGILIIVMLAFFDSSIRTPVIFSKTVNLKLISIVNFMDLKQKSLNELVTATDLSYDPEDKQRFHNVFRESLRKLRYEIEITGKKVFLFTSTAKGEGKTTLIQALSYSMSLSKKRILIIDTNFCNNDLTLMLDGAPILEKIIPSDRSNESLADQVRSLSKEVGIGGVFIIGSQGGDYTPSEILPRKNLLHYLHSLTSEYDYIFLEGPPLNDFSDTRELTQYVDGVIAVFSAGHVVNQIDKESMQYFRELNGKFCGAVLNKVDLKMVSVT